MKSFKNLSLMLTIGALTLTLMALTHAPNVDRVTHTPKYSTTEPICLTLMIDGEEREVEVEAGLNNIPLFCGTHTTEDIPLQFPVSIFGFTCSTITDSVVETIAENYASALCSNYCCVSPFPDVYPNPPCSLTCKIVPGSLQYDCVSGILVMKFTLGIGCS